MSATTVERPAVPFEQNQQQSPSPTDIFDPSSPYPFFKISPLFAKGQLLNATGHEVSWEELKGKSVALYFAEDANKKCKTFLPVLKNAYRTYNESGDTQKVEIIFVSLDATEEQYHVHRHRQPWLALPFADPLTEKFKGHFRVMNPTELPKYGYGPRIGVPALLVVASDGKLLQQMDVGEQGRSILKKWDVISNRF